MICDLEVMLRDEMGVEDIKGVASLRTGKR